MAGETSTIPKFKAGDRIRYIRIGHRRGKPQPGNAGTITEVLDEDVYSLYKYIGGLNGDYCPQLYRIEFDDPLIGIWDCRETSLEPLPT